MPQPSSYNAWVTRMERPLLWASVLFLALICIPVVRTDAGTAERLTLTVLNVAVWLLFAVDYVVRLYLAEGKWRFVKGHILDLIVVLVPFLRPLRLLRLVSMVAVLARRSSGAMVADLTKYVTVAASASVVLGGVAILGVERGHADTPVHSFADGLWFSVSTLTAVPYGDVYPVTQAGRLIAVVLMIVGLVLVGVITAAITAWLVSFFTNTEEIEETLAVDQIELAEIFGRLRTIEATIGGRGGAPVA